MNNKDIFARNVILLNIINEIKPFLKLKNIEIILLKGAAYLELGILKIDERQMSDIDILLRPKDLKDFIEILINLSFKEMPESATAWYRSIKENIPPLIIDIHTTLWHVKNIEEIWHTKVEISENIYVPAPEELLLFAVTHPVFHHGFFDKKSAYEIRKILESNGNGENLLEKAIEKAKRRGISRLFATAITTAFPEKNNILPADITMREFLLLPLINLAFKKHYAFNEYLLPFLYRPGNGLKLLFPGREFMRRRHGSSRLWQRARRIAKILSRMVGK